MIIKVKNYLPKTLTTIIILTAFSNSANAAGISVDAGLTPPEDRWILRTQVRYRERRDDPTDMNRKMETYVLPVVLAYGLRSDLTLLIRQRVISHKMSAKGTTDRNEGFGDLFILAKYRAYRLNTPNYTLGIAPTIGLEFPTGHDSFTSDTWDLKPGLFFSGRRGPWAVDLNIAYKWNGFADRGKDGRDPGDEVSLDLAFAHQFSIGGRGFASLAPVLELTYNHIWTDEKRGHDIDNTGETFFYLSPGIKFSTSSLILEALVQIPVWQDQKGSQLEQDVGILAGVRFLF
jgi:hypothetical protein